MHHGFEDYGFGMGWGWLIGLIVLVVVIWLVVKAIYQRNSKNVSPKKSSLDILKERYAHSEIKKEEFEEKKNSISLLKN